MGSSSNLIFVGYFKYIFLLNTTPDTCTSNCMDLNFQIHQNSRVHNTTNITALRLNKILPSTPTSGLKKKIFLLDIQFTVHNSNDMCSTSNLIFICTHFNGVHTHSTLTVFYSNFSTHFNTTVFRQQKLLDANVMCSSCRQLKTN